MKDLTKTISIYGFTHALVDATCIAVIFSNLNTASDSDLYIGIILYNILAFGLQAPFGFIADKLKKPSEVAILGCVLTALSAIFSNYLFPAVFLAGLGNALFHVGGGIVSLDLGKGKATLPGIYVAPGAIGLFVGGLIGKMGYYNPIPFVGLLCIMSLLMYTTKHTKRNEEKTNNIKFNNVELIIALFLISISIRALIGLSLNLPWKTDIYLLSSLIMAISLGKAFGGILGDKYGWKKIALSGLLISAPLLAFGNNYPLLAISGAFFFNLTMPVTLVAIANRLPENHGFAFGLTTLALVTTAVPVLMGAKDFFSNSMVMFILILLSALILYKAFDLYYKKEENDKNI